MRFNLANMCPSSPTCTPSRSRQALFELWRLLGEAPTLVEYDELLAKLKQGKMYTSKVKSYFEAEWLLRRRSGRAACYRQVRRQDRRARGERDGSCKPTKPARPSSAAPTPITTRRASNMGLHKRLDKRMNSLLLQRSGAVLPKQTPPSTERLTQVGVAAEAMQGAHLDNSVHNPWHGAALQVAPRHTPSALAGVGLVPATVGRAEAASPRAGG